jgi:hypothetical protein
MLVRGVLRPRILGLCRPFGEFLRKLRGVHGMFQSLLAEFISRQVISLIMGHGGGLVSVTRKVV